MHIFWKIIVWINVISILTKIIWVMIFPIIEQSYIRALSALADNNSIQTKWTDIFHLNLKWVKMHTDRMLGQQQQLNRLWIWEQTYNDCCSFESFYIFVLLQCQHLHIGLVYIWSYCTSMHIALFKMVVFGCRLIIGNVYLNVAIFNDNAQFQIVIVLF